jgi:hypothetical protein
MLRPSRLRLGIGQRVANYVTTSSGIAGAPNTTTEMVTRLRKTAPQTGM